MSLDHLNRIKSYLCEVMPEDDHSIITKSKDGKHFILFHGFWWSGNSPDFAAEDCLNKLECLHNHLQSYSEPNGRLGQNG